MKKSTSASTHSRQHVIVGNCIAAVSAAETLRKLNPQDSIVIIGEEAVPSYSRCLITYFLGDMITRKHLMSHDTQWYAERNIDLMLSTRAEGLDVKNRQVFVKQNGKNKKISYDTLLVATGSTPIYLPAFPYDPNGIIGMRNFANSAQLKSWAKKGKKAIIIGAGFVGLKSAYGLVKQGVQVKVVELLPTVLGRMTDLEASARVRACNDFLKGSGVAIDRIVLVDDHQQTSVDGIYAAGDVCRSRHIVTGEWIYNAIWPVAATGARIASANMSGEKLTYEGNIPINSVDFYELWITAIGNVQEEDPDVKEITFTTPAIYQKVKLRNGVPFAFMSIGNVDGAGIIRGAIVGKTPWEEFIRRPQAKVLPVVNQAATAAA